MGNINPRVQGPAAETVPQKMRRDPLPLPNSAGATGRTPGRADLLREVRSRCWVWVGSEGEGGWAPLAGGSPFPYPQWYSNWGGGPPTAQQRPSAHQVALAGLLARTQQEWGRARPHLKGQGEFRLEGWQTA